MVTILSDLIEKTERPAGERIIVGGDAAASFPPLDAQMLALRAWARPESGERIGILLPNIPAFPPLFHALTGAGASTVLMNPLSSRRELTEVVEDAGVRRIVSLEALRTRCPEVEVLPLEDFAAAPPQSGRRLLPEEKPEPDDEAVVLYTAAMDGWAKGARLSHRNLIANAHSAVQAMGMNAADVVVGALPWIHLFGLTVTLNAPLLAGASILPVQRFHPQRMLDATIRSGGTVLVGVPSMYSALCDVAERSGGLGDHRIRLAISGGAVLPNETARRFEAFFGIPLRQGYGLTEGGPVCLFNRADEPNRMGTLGTPFPDVEASVAGPDGRPVVDGAVGELRIRGDNVFLGYVGEAGPHLQDGWLRTGDLVSRDGDGVYRFRGMLKSMFTRSGFNVYPREVARALQEDERIHRALVCAAPDPLRENELVLDIIPAPGHEIDEPAVRALCQQALAAYKQPGRIRIVTDDSSQPNRS